MIQARKAETRLKIQLGGLVAKAGLAGEASNVLLGLLLEAADALTGETAAMVRRRWERRGKQAFENDGAGHGHF